ncbi:alpha/beta hydrolase-fold protein [Vreelandella alkaliphila]|uniref:Prolyl oligopeptidase family serine peptidase n=1 Tax=Vreelandella alkaliphila TaxID=272774 RepID=A0A7C9K4C3_9GAMM|nr:PHB depolymerase family esterase [Halomonas alkaliphila]NDL70082.1 prolyl oligopeptidase family serine peptidase [Halomonas alkaliphila]
MMASAACKSRLLSVLVLLGSSAAYAETGEEPRGLPALSAASDHASVVGTSSGGYMATQLAVAWPERFSGVGVLAAGPWSCSQGALSLALNQCMSTRRGPPSLDTLDQRWERYASLDQVGDQEALSQLRVFVWHGEEDDVVLPELGGLLAEQWQRWLVSPKQLRYVRSENTGHGWPIRLPKHVDANPQAFGGCRQGGGSHVLACDEDVSGDMLTWLYPDREANASEGELMAFDQSDYAVKGFADVGYVYIPKACEEGGCPVTVALHGCQMSVDAIGDTFVRHSGLNHWAAEHGQVVLYPQAKSSMANPQGCWDWWGFSESTWQINPLHDTREGTQTRALMKMLDQLQSAP